MELTSFSFSVQRGEDGERSEEDAQIGEGDEEGEPIHGDGDQGERITPRKGAQ